MAHGTRTGTHLPGRTGRLGAVLRFKCPHCREGRFFVDGNPYNLRHVGDVLDACPACGRKYSPEPGFYYGAMYLSYALAVLLMGTTCLMARVLWPPMPLWGYVWVSVGPLVLLGPWLYALSKILWANLFFRYKGPTGAGAEHEG